MPDPDDRISEIYQASRQQLEPPRELDQRILAEAHRAVGRRHLPYRSLVLAATVVIGVGLAWLQLHAPQIVEDALAPTQQAKSPPADSDMMDAPAMKRRDTPAPTTIPFAETESSPGPAAAKPALSAPSMQPGPEPPRHRFHRYNGTISTTPEADNSVATEAEVRQTAPDPVAPCGLDAMPADKAAWHRAIADARLRGDDATVACLQQAMREAVD